MEKCEIESLISKKSERLTYQSHKDRSQAWATFLKILVDDELCDFVKCIDCSSVLKYISGHGTGSMLSHIKACKTSKGKVKQNTIAFMPSFAAAPTKRTLSAVDKADFTNCLTYMCAKDIR